MTSSGRKRQRAGDADALPLAAGEAVRIALDVPQVETDQRDQLVHHFPARARIADAVDDQRLFDDVVDRHARVQRAERVLKDELHLPPEALQSLAFERQDIDRTARGR